MVDKKIYLIGFLIITLFSSGVLYVQYESDFGDTKFRVDKDCTNIYYKDLDTNRWRIGGKEINTLWSGATKINRDLSELKLIDEIGENNETWTRYRITKYIRGPTIIDEYFFDGLADNIELVPKYHKITIINATGFIYQYQVQRLGYQGNTRFLDGIYSMNFDHNIKVEWTEGNYYSKIYKYKGKDEGKLTIRYRIKSDYEVFYNRLFDPANSTTILTLDGLSSDRYYEHGSVCELKGVILNGTSKTKNYTAFVPVADSFAYIDNSNFVKYTFNDTSNFYNSILHIYLARYATGEPDDNLTVLINSDIYTLDKDLLGGGFDNVMFNISIGDVDSFNVILKCPNCITTPWCIGRKDSLSSGHTYTSTDGGINWLGSSDISIQLEGYDLLYNSTGNNICLNIDQVGYGDDFICGNGSVAYNLTTNAVKNTIINEKDKEDSYSCSGDFDVACSNAVDESWSSTAWSTPNKTGIVYENITIPNNIKDIKWKGKWNKWGGDAYIQTYCYNSTDWILLYTSNSASSEEKTLEIPSDCSDSILQIKTELHSATCPVWQCRAGYTEGKAIFYNNSFLFNYSDSPINNTIFVEFNKYDDVQSAYINLTGYENPNYPKNIKVKNGEEYIEIPGILNNSIIDIINFTDGTNNKFFNFSSAGINVSKFNISKKAKNINITLNITGINQTSKPELNWYKQLAIGTLSIGGMVSESGYIYVLDFYGQIFKYDINGNKIGVFGYYGVEDIELSGDYLYISGNKGFSRISKNDGSSSWFNYTYWSNAGIIKITIQGDYIYGANSMNTTIIKVNKNTGSIISQFEDVGDEPYQIDSDSNYLFVAGMYGEIDVYYLSNLTLMTTLLPYNTTLPGSVIECLYVDKNYLYASYLDGTIIRTNKTQVANNWTISSTSNSNYITGDSENLYIAEANGMIEKIDKQTGQSIFAVYINDSNLNHTEAITYQDGYLYTAQKGRFLAKTSRTIGYPLNPKIDCNGDNIYEWSWNGNYKSSSLVYCIEDNISSDSPIYEYPIYYSNGDKGILNVSFIKGTYDINPFNLNASVINDYLSSQSSGFHNVPIKISSESNTIIQIDNINITYYGSDNISVTAHFDGDGTYSASNDTHTISVVYSQFNTTIPINYQSLEWIPKSPTNQDVSAYGMRDEYPAIRITSLNYDQPMNLSISLNESYSCINMTFSTTFNKSAGILLNTTYQDINTNLNLTNITDLYGWLDYGCNFTDVYWRWWKPLIQLKGCAYNSVKCE